MEKKSSIDDYEDQAKRSGLGLIASSFEAPAPMDAGAFCFAMFPIVSASLQTAYR